MPLQTCALPIRSEEHTSELQHTIISYAVFCLKKKESHRGGHWCRAARAGGVGRCAGGGGVVRRRARAPALRGPLVVFFFLMIGRPRKSPPFPHWALFR